MFSFFPPVALATNIRHLSDLCVKFWLVILRLSRSFASSSSRIFTWHSIPAVRVNFGIYCSSWSIKLRTRYTFQSTHALGFCYIIVWSLKGEKRHQFDLLLSLLRYAKLQNQQQTRGRFLFRVWYTFFLKNSSKTSITSWRKQEEN